MGQKALHDSLLMLYTGWETREIFMDEARSKHGSAHYHQWNWQCWDRLPGVIAEEGLVEFVEELCLRFGLFDDNTQVSL